MNNNQAWFVQTRADSLAMLFLTRIPTLVIERLNADIGVDYLVKITHKKKISTRFFGVEVKASQSMSALIGSSGMLKKNLASPLFRIAADLTFPLAILAIDIVTEEIQFGWIKPPIHGASANGAQEKIGIPMQVATQKELSRAVSDVEIWYSKNISL